ncbi:hypothetical protein [Microvirga brassicacearum]|uniref:hypothetical protein n=1 Tax=Microvirga brassicacearum TaxID=2580413 RepID=UPI001390BDEA|nr:hypothetical protein [Microvirga brassicacearum]
MAFLPELNATAISPNSNAIDIRFNTPNHGDVIAELKPAVAGQTKYPIRFAVGQVLEYRHFQCPKAHPLIVLGAKPKAEEIEFCHAIGISVAWRHRTRSSSDGGVNGQQSDERDDFRWMPSEFRVDGDF